MLRNQRKPPAAGKRDLLSRPDGVGALSLADNKRPPGAARGTGPRQDPASSRWTSYISIELLKRAPCLRPSCTISGSLWHRSHSTRKNRRNWNWKEFEAEWGKRYPAIGQAWHRAWVVLRQTASAELVGEAERDLRVGIALIRRQLEACRLAVVFRGQRRWRCNGYLLWSVELERLRFMLL
jgi:hypothetical protein